MSVSSQKELDNYLLDSGEHRDNLTAMEKELIQAEEQKSDSGDDLDKIMNEEENVVGSDEEGNDYLRLSSAQPQSLAELGLDDLGVEPKISRTSS